MSTDPSYLSNSNADYVETLYQQYKQNPSSVDFGWQKFFEGFEFSKTDFGSPRLADAPESALKEIKVRNLIFGYRNRGHLFTHTNPVRERRKYFPTLALESFGLANEDLDTVFQAGIEIGLPNSSLRNIVSHLETTYCESIGAEFLYMPSVEIVKWLQDKMETCKNQPKFDLETKKHILHKLNQAVTFESFLGSKYVGEKRFSLEGAENLIPALDAIIEWASDNGGVKEFVLGMAHRGRLNVLANILNKTYEDIFSEFEGNYNYVENLGGDVKYHMGFSSAVKTERGEMVHLSLCPNPSHLESVAPVAQGISRAKIDNKYNGDSTKVATIILHGDSSIAGQGVVYEVAQMSELDACKTGGTVHIVINNQIGFTTNYLEARSSIYCTDVAKVTQSPVFHVNGDDAEAVVYACELAMEFRQKFQKDVYIDLLCYRRHGHNEGDEPRFTQPSLYKAIDGHPNPREIYFKKLVEEGSVEPSLAKELEKSFKLLLQDRLNQVKETRRSVEYNFEQSGWKNLRIPENSDFDKSPNSGVKETRLKALAERMLTLPENMTFYDKYIRINEARRESVKANKLDWGLGELLAYATLLDEGYNVRISGQDVERGTFAHRHAIVKVNNSEEEYIALQKIAPKQGRFEIYNSLLSEYAVVGFEFGYSWSAPDSLVVWEAQFGDFVNGAQIILDQYITSALTKWKRLSGLVMLLPHGFEGQGPEHSSARMERFLELCVDNNIQVANCTTPSNIFHLMRRQMLRDFRTPLVVFSPKSLLRHPDAVSSIQEFSEGGFREVIDDPEISDPGKVKKVILCSGKIYYDLLKKQREEKKGEVALVRLEQIYPIPILGLRAIQKRYNHAQEWVWVQEEPENMGAWPFLLRKLREFNLSCVSRRESASPAVGYKKLHEEQQKSIIEKAFTLSDSGSSKSGNGSGKVLVKK